MDWMNGRIVLGVIFKYKKSAFTKYHNVAVVKINRTIDSIYTSFFNHVFLSKYQ